jgi:hypothetical protein
MIVYKLWLPCLYDWIYSFCLACTIWMLISAPGTCFQRTVAGKPPLHLCAWGVSPWHVFPAGVSHFRSKPLDRNLLPRVFIVLTELLKKLVWWECLLNMILFREINWCLRSSWFVKLRLPLTLKHAIAWGNNDQKSSSLINPGLKYLSISFYLLS